jgi:hypothetical protein
LPCRHAGLLLRTVERGSKTGPAAVAALRRTAAGQADDSEAEEFLKACWRLRQQEGSAP